MPLNRNFIYAKFNSSCEFFGTYFLTRSANISIHFASNNLKGKIDCYLAIQANWQESNIRIHLSIENQKNAGAKSLNNNKLREIFHRSGSMCGDWNRELLNRAIDLKSELRFSLYRCCLTRPAFFVSNCLTTKMVHSKEIASIWLAILIYGQSGKTKTAALPRFKCLLKLFTYAWPSESIIKTDDCIRN